LERVVRVLGPQDPAPPMSQPHRPLMPEIRPIRHPPKATPDNAYPGYEPTLTVGYSPQNELERSDRDPALDDATNKITVGAVDEVLIRRRAEHHEITKLALTDHATIVETQGGGTSRGC